MILASHVIFSAYGFWLPNDPRGSWSDFVGKWELFRFGGASKVETRHSLAREPYDKSVSLAAKTSLRLPAVQFNGEQARAVARCFATSLDKGHVTCLACAILPEHVHMVLERHRCNVESLVKFLKGAATRELVEENLHPLARFRPAEGRVPRCWSRGEWKVYLYNEEDIRQAIAYVEANPLKEGKPGQRWTFVTPYGALGGDRNSHEG
jgi:REP element-mobilizing transposase RayT